MVMMAMAWGWQSLGCREGGFAKHVHHVRLDLRHAREIVIRILNTEHIVIATLISVIDLPSSAAGGDVNVGVDERTSNAIGRDGVRLLD